jgi:leader peptidase (prepilin peptidase)/N-methyltransferase
MQFVPGIGFLAPHYIAPIWLTVLAGVLLGYLLGGGIVWAIRILGSLGFGKEAMGLGDVHLMAAVGACLGWVDSALAFFAAAFVGLAWFLLGTAFSGAFRRTLPYGPYLAVATLLVVLGKPLIEAGLGRLTGHPVPLPP